MKYLLRFGQGLLLCSIMQSCFAQKKIQRAANTLLTDSIVKHAHTGISIYDVTTGSFLYTQNADKYFVPASNTKLYSLYAGLTYIGDSIPTLRLYELEDKIVIEGMGDPTFLHPDFTSQPVFDYLKTIEKPIFYLDTWKENAWGKGWAWDDFADYYMGERAQMPVYGNILRFDGNINSPFVSPSHLDSTNIFRISGGSFINKAGRDRYSNKFTVTANGKTRVSLEVPFITSPTLLVKLLADTLHKNITILTDTTIRENIPSRILYNRPADSMYVTMMNRSDNLFAEQTLLMASNARLGYMSDEDMIKTLLDSQLKALPQRPVWVDGSGLSRYNLFSPNDMVFILDKLRKNFGFERMKRILPTGGKGTLKYYYRNATDSIFAKTGTLSNHVALSGYIISRKGKLLIFSVLVNLYTTEAPPVRRKVEAFLEEIRMKN